MCKITKATLKAFVRKNSDRLFSKELSSFDSTVDCVMPGANPFKKVNSVDLAAKNTLGIKDIWLVGNSDDHFTHYEDVVYTGIAGSNCCGDWIVAVEKGGV